MRRAKEFLFVATCVCTAMLVQHECDAQRSEDVADIPVFDTPLIDYNKPTVELAYGDSWSVTCIFNESITWVRYNDFDQEEYDYGERIENEPNDMYKVILHINDATANKVGRYYCVQEEDLLEDYAVVNGVENIPSIYVYVRDHLHTIVPLKDIITIDRYDHFIVPCKPSHPEVKIQICNPLDDECISEYDPMMGFNVTAQSFNVKFLKLICKSANESVEFTVRLKSDNKEDNSTFATPQINNKIQTVELAHGDNWNVSCMSNETIRWIRYDPWNKGNLVKVKSIEYITNEPDQMYVSILKITNASATEVGRYYCTNQRYLDNLEGQYDELIQAMGIPRIYVYVRDLEQTIVPLPDKPIIIDQYDHFIIPCMPSHRAVKVELCNPLDDVCLKEHDPEMGFNITAHSFKINILEFLCVYKSNHKRITARLKSIDEEHEEHVEYEEDEADEEDEEDDTSIYVDYDNEIVVMSYRGNWNVSCTSNKPIIWHWHDPLYKRNSKSIKNIEYAADDPNAKYGAILLITNASAEVVGRYNCVTKENLNEVDDGYLHFRSIYVYVQDTDHPIVPVSTDPLDIRGLGEFVVPCKPSHPGAKLKLCHEKSGFCFKEFDPEKGFTGNVTSFDSNNLTLDCTSSSSKKEMKVFLRDIKIVHQREGMNISLLLVLVIFVGICIVFAVLYYKKRKEVQALQAEELAAMLNGDLDSYSPTMTLNEQTDRLPYKIEYELPKEKLILQEQLGEGAFGVVMKGTAIGIVGEESETTVAVKMVKKKYDIEALQALVAELKMMIHLGQHLNVVNLLGAVTKNIGNRELMVIVEYCPFGNLLNFLRNNRARFINEINLRGYNSEISSCPSTAHHLRAEASATNCDRSISTTDLICWAFQIANGMHYLTSRKVLHGDLAARNVLLSNDNVVKICDFGLSRSLYNGDKYKKTNKTPLPVRWLALECFSDGLFSTYSDIWAYGIVLWELFSLGMVPYPGVEVYSDLYTMLQNGFRMECPPFSNQDIYDIMLSCWRVRPDSRPSFEQLSANFSAMLVQETKDYYLDLNEPYLAINNARMISCCTEYLPPETDAPLVPESEGRSGEYREDISGQLNITIEPNHPSSTNHNEPDYANVNILNHK